MNSKRELVHPHIVLAAGLSVGLIFTINTSVSWAQGTNLTRGNAEVTAQGTVQTKVKDDTMLRDIQISKVPDQKALSIRDRVSADQLSEHIGAFLRTVWAHIAQLGKKPAGPPFTRIHGSESGMIDLEAGIPVSEALPETGKIRLTVLPGGEVAHGDHFGPYENLGAARDALKSWAQSNRREQASLPWESYETDPGVEPDPKKWRTKITLPLK
jgi:AraC family transcriptional regulator